jgi:hypothetical protein
MFVPRLRRIFSRRRTGCFRSTRPGLELLEARFVPASLTRLPPVLVNPGNPAQGVDPSVSSEASYAPPGVSVAEDAAGDFVVTWETSTGNGYDVLAQRFDPLGHPLGSLITVASGIAPTSQTPRPSVGMDSAGDFVIAYDTVSGIFASRYTASGTSIDSVPFQVDSQGNTFEDSGPSVALNDQGGFVISYVGFDSMGSVVEAQLGSTSGANPISGGPTTVAFSTFSSFVFYQSAAVASDAAGNFVVAYEPVSFLSSVSSSVLEQRFDASGNALGSPLTLSTSGSAASPSVAVARATGEFAVTWVDVVKAGPVLFAETFDASGQTLAGPFAVSTAANPPAIQQPYDSPSVAADATGNFVAIWANHAVPEFPGPGPGVVPNLPPDTEPTGDVFVQTFDASGNLTGGPVTITSQPNAPGTVGVAMDPNGNFVAAFVASQQTITSDAGPSATGNSYDVIAVIFRHLPTSVPVVPVTPTPPANTPTPTTSMNPAASIALSQEQEQDPQRKAQELPIEPPQAELVPGVKLPLALLPVIRRANPAATLVQQLGGTGAVGAISGRLFADLNGDGIFSADKPPLEGRLVFLDLNDNGVLDEGEPVTVTNANGEYSFSGLHLQTYQVRQLLVAGDTQTLPAENRAWEVRLDNSQYDAGGRNFGTVYMPRRAGPPTRAPALAPQPTPAPVPGAAGDEVD